MGCPEGQALLPSGIGGVTRVVLLLALVAIVVWGAWLGWRRLRPTRRALQLPAGEVAGDGPIVRAFGRLEVRMAMTGAARRPSETAAEVLARVADLRSDRSRAALTALESERYGPTPPPAEQSRAAVSEIDTLVPFEDQSSTGPRAKPIA